MLQSAGLTKAAKQTLTESIVQSVRDADDKLVPWAQLKTIEAAIEEAKKELRADIVDFAEKYEKGPFMHRGASFEVKDAGVKYDYTGCGDVVWNELNTKMEKLKEELKERELYLRSLKGRTPCVDEDTGESWDAYPPVRKATTTVEVKLK